MIEFINKNYIPIRVDADRHPDIDNLYNQGGWPSTVILTPEGEILNGGTYIPPERMLKVLKDTLEFYKFLCPLHFTMPLAGGAAFFHVLEAPTRRSGPCFLNYSQVKQVMQHEW